MSQVKSASVDSKRAFLEGKGLNAAEIDEGFRRVPESSAAGTGAGAQAAPTKPFPVGGAASTLNALQPGQPAYPQQIVVQQPPPPPQPQPIRWTQVLPLWVGLHHPYNGWILPAPCNMSTHWNTSCVASC